MLKTWATIQELNRRLKAWWNTGLNKKKLELRPVRLAITETSGRRRPSSSATTTTLNSNLGQRPIGRLRGKRSPQAGDGNWPGVQDWRGARTGGGGLICSFVTELLKHKKSFTILSWLQYYLSFTRAVNAKKAGILRFQNLYTLPEMGTFVAIKNRP